MKLLKWLFNPEWFLLRMDGGGGGGGAPAQQTNISDLPEWAKPFAQKTLGMAEALTTKKDEKGNITGPSDYQTYDKDRFEGFDPLQERAYQNVGNMQIPGQTGEASNIAQEASYRALNSQYQPGQFGNQFRAPRDYQPGQFGNQFQAPRDYQTGQFDYLQAQAPELEQYQMDPAERVQGGQYDAPTMDAAQTGYNPNLQNYQMGPAERVGTQDYTGQNVEKYMDPFMQNVVNKQTREAERQAGIAALQRKAQDIQQGAFGGTSSRMRDALASRDLERLKSDIYGTGQQAAFQNAQQQFNTQQQRELGAQQANQAAGLTVGGQNLAANLGVQQLGTQTGQQTALANLSAQQQANVQNQAAKLQAQGLTAGQAMQAALANQQAGLTVGQQNLAAKMGTQQFGAGQNMQAQLANQQARAAAQTAREQSRQFGAGQGMTAAQARAQYGLSGQQLGEQSRQFGAGQGMTAAQTRAQYGLAGQQLGEQSRQFGAGYGQQGLNTALQGASQLGNLGQTQFGQQKDLYALQNQYGEQARQLRQQNLTQQYQDFLNQQKYPYQQLEYMSNILRGTPMGTVNTMYSAQPSMSSQLAGLGLAGAGMYGLANRKKGGAIKDKAKAKTRAGLNELALMKMGV